MSKYYFEGQKISWSTNKKVFLQIWWFGFIFHFLFFRTKNTLLEKLLYYLISSAHKDKARKLLSTSLTLCRVHFSHILQAQCRMFLYNVDMMSFILLLFFELSCVDVWSINYSGCLTHTHTHLRARTHARAHTHTIHLCGTCFSLPFTHSNTEPLNRFRAPCLCGHLGLPTYWHTYTPMCTYTHSDYLLLSTSSAVVNYKYKTIGTIGDQIGCLFGLQFWICKNYFLFFLQCNLSGVALEWTKKKFCYQRGGFLVIDLSQITLHQEVQELIFNLRNRTKLIQYQHWGFYTPPSPQHTHPHTLCYMHSVWYHTV